MITRKSLAADIDALDQSIADLNASKKASYDAYRDQMVAAGVGKQNASKELEAVKTAIKRCRALSKDPLAVDEKDALVDEIVAEIRAPARAHGNIEKIGADKQAKLIATVATGMQTEIGRKALVTALDTMIEREDADMGNPTSLPAHDPITGEIAETNPEAKASEDNGATVLDIEVPADSVTGDVSRPSVCGGSDALIHRVMSMTPLEPREAGGLKGFGFTVTFDDPPAKAISEAEMTAFLKKDSTVQPARNERCQGLKKDCQFASSPSKIACSQCETAWQIALRKREAA